MEAILRSDINITISGNDFNVFNGFKRFNYNYKINSVSESQCLKSISIGTFL